MILEGLHEKDIFKESYPFRLEVNTSSDFHYPLHWHSAIELIYNCTGACSVTVNGQVYTLSDNDILLIPSGEIHDIHVSGTGKRFFIQFDLSLLDVFGGISNVKPVFLKALIITMSESEILHGTLEKHIIAIIEEYNAKEAAYSLALNARILDILVLLSRNLNLSNSSESVSSSKKVFGLEKINSSFKYIEANYQNDITLKEVSAAVGFSEYHFSRLFKEITEKNFHSYLNEFRIKKAEKLLINQDMSVAQIAHEVGFNSIATFNRTFRRFKGCPPTSCRMK